MRAPDSLVRLKLNPEARMTEGGAGGVRRPKLPACLVWVVAHSFQSLPFASAHVAIPSSTMNASTAIRSLTRTSQQTLRSHIGLKRTWPAPSASLLRKPIQTPQTPLQRLGIRCHSTETSNTRAPKPLTDRDSIPEEDVKSDKDEIAARKALQPCYDMTFTCKKCLDRSSHRITKQAYHFGTVLVNCPGCKSRHLIADHMKVGVVRIHP